MFLSKNTICCEDTSNVFCVLSRNVRCDREMRLQIFLSCRKYLCEFVLVIMLDHLIVYVLTVRLEFFRDDERDLIRFFRDDKDLTRRLIRLDESDSSNLTKAAHQTWLDDFSSNLTDDISSNLMSCISSNLKNDISSNLMSCISSNLMSGISSNLMSCISSNLMDDISSNLMTASHQIWWAASHQIWWAAPHQTLRKEGSLSTFWWAKNFCCDTWCEELSLAEGSLWR